MTIVQRSLRVAGLVAAVGFLAALGLALGRGDSLHDAAVLAGVASGTALVASLVGWLLLAPLRRRSVGAQAVGVALVVAAAVALGVLAAARAMFISAHDLTALGVVLVAAASAGAGAAVGLGARVQRDSHAVSELAGQLGQPGQASEADPPTAELAMLAQRIAQVSAELDEARARERALEQSRRELIAWISHDLRGPLSSIRAMAEAMEDGIVTDAATVDRYHRTIRTETERLAQLVDDLFELSRINAGAAAVRRERTALAPVIGEVVATASARAARAGVVLEPRCGPLPDLDVSVPELSRVLHNLLDNALRHTPPGGTVVVDARAQPAAGDRAEDCVIVTVRDQCGGIPEADLDRVFDLAFRGDLARGRDGGGGLGLTIAKGLVEAHDGSIVVANEPDGCRFTIALPCAPAPAP